MFNRKRFITSGLALVLSAVLAFEPVAVAAADGQVVADQVEEIVEETNEESTTETSGEISEETDNNDISDDISEENAGEESAQDSSDEEAEVSDEDSSDEEDNSVSDNDATVSDNDEFVSDNDAEDETVSDNAAEEASVSDNDAEEADETDLEDSEEECLITELSDSYVLSEFETEVKLLTEEYMSDFDTAVEGKDYVAGQVYCITDSYEKALMIADAYHGSLVSYEYEVAVIDLDGVTVEQAMKAGADMDMNLPAVSPNYFRYADTDDSEYEEVSEADYTSEDGVSNEDSSEDSSEDETDVEISEEDSIVWGEDPYANIEVIADSEEACGTVVIEDNDAFTIIEEVSEITEEEMDTVIKNNNTDPYLNSTNANYQWFHSAIGSGYAWTAGYTGSGVSVCVIDSGVLSGHEDLSLTEVKSGVTGVTAGTDPAGHGTHVTGLVSAKANGKGGVGVAPNATTYVYGTANSKKELVDSAIISGISYAVTKNVDLVNMSFGSSFKSASEEALFKIGYNQGVIFFASAGNDGHTNYNYPAASKYVYTVAALTEGLQRTVFSNYGNYVDFAAPGEHIMSTTYASTSSYGIMDGTSMACPIFVGEVALVLQAAKNDKLSGLKLGSKNGDRVNAVIKYLKSKCKKTGSGTGAGYLYLPNALEIDDSIVAPKPVTIKVKSTSPSTVVYTITGQLGTTVRYTTDGSVPGITNGDTISFANTNTATKQFTIPLDKKTITIKFVAINRVGVCSAVKSITFTPKQNVRSIGINSAYTTAINVAQGKSTVIQATVTPVYAANKKLNWIFVDSNGTDITAAVKLKGLTVSNGKVSASRTATIGTYYVMAVAADGSRVKSVKVPVKVNTVASLAKVSKLTFNKIFPINRSASNATRNLGADLTITLISGEKVSGTKLSTDLIWTSSNTAVATVNASGSLTCLAPGKTTITALANDGSGKKASVTITVVQLVTSITLNTTATSVAAGKSVNYTATVNSNANNKKVKWEIVYASGKNAANTGVSITQTGKLTTKSNSYGTYTIKATATDGSGVSKTASITVNGYGINKVVAMDVSVGKALKSANIFRVTGVSGAPVEQTLYFEIDGSNISAIPNASVFTATSSNTAVATITDKQIVNLKGIRFITVKVKATGKTTGKTIVTLTTNDGSAKKCSVTVNVINPASELNLSGPTTQSGRNDQGIWGYCAQGSSIKIVSKLYEEYGKVSNKKLKWSIVSGGSYGTISQAGVLSVNRTAVKDSYIKVKAETTDGSYVSATFVIKVTSKITYLDIPSIKYTGWWHTYINYSQFFNSEGELVGAYLPVSYSGTCTDMVVNVSSPDIASGTIVWDNGKPYLVLVPLVKYNSGTQKTITIKVTAYDGTPKGKTYSTKLDIHY